ncbi:2-oxoglutarate dehydrogenase E1 component [Desulfuromonas carbonis]|uniref:2-oxoglutarate dehydrogenase E1 component n=1 Tax=Desulfuromonas sp. DDH964 TaxID=1823759 RepID=UPI00078CB8D0|nr:2-oxoglutarate dehydrogenase E1 component [Desulfuromonas sp. DDH964]AMV73552.1 2-oxoglutarate dehydrogenase E1 component [Desulfuromonas sp. DDH964]
MNILNNISSQWLDDQYRRWRQDPSVVSADWQAFFSGFELVGTPTSAAGSAKALKEAAVQSLLYRYRDLGHLLACTDPLSPCRSSHPLLDLESFGLSEEDLDTEFTVKRFLRDRAPLREILAVMRDTYCRTIGVEFMHIQDPAERQWLKDRMEPIRNRPRFERPRQLKILAKLQEATLFETFLHRNFLGQKRFSLEGGETIIPLLDAVVEKAAALGCRDLVLGMAHRGRLNVLANIFRKPFATIFAEFQDNLQYNFVGEGDVKYHKGFSSDFESAAGNRIHLTMASNPSHLEAVDPVVVGKARARQDHYGADGPQLVLPVLIHGDAAFAGQGVVAETLNLSQLEGYGTGGTLHVVLNNQIGFTTAPHDARSTFYATDIAKMLMVPIFHVHGEDPEAATYLAELALDYRRTFAKDVVIEVICFRRQGHNEGDEPYFTQPLMYDKIKARPPVHELYEKTLLDQGFEPEEIEAPAKATEARLEEALAKGGNQDPDHGFRGKWSSIERSWSPARPATAVEATRLRELARQLAVIPENFHPHPKIAKLLEKRLEAVEQGNDLDWGNAETLAYANLLAEGHSVRLSGQDSRRGTFNHRHSVLIDIENGLQYVPLVTVTDNDSVFRVYNSMLSEAAVLGFEYGYSLETPHGLTIWEAQFGDFANGAQVIIDQFLTSSETKWDRSSGLVLFLPHGYEGQGAEHSSARIERYLQLCADHNLQVVYPSTPAQFFHLLRRQVKLPFRRPLIVFTPKSLLRLPACRSTLEELVDGSFQPVIAPGKPPKKVKEVLLCSGKVFYDLEAKRSELEREEVAIIRLEQLYPIPQVELEEILAPYIKQKCRFTWVQEEPKNAGAWNFIHDLLAKVTGARPRYVGRPRLAAPEVGSHRLHKQEQERLVNEAIDG